jgi:hypothetical protein
MGVTNCTQNRALKEEGRLKVLGDKGGGSPARSPLSFPESFFSRHHFSAPPLKEKRSSLFAETLLPRSSCGASVLWGSGGVIRWPTEGRPTNTGVLPHRYPSSNGPAFLSSRLMTTTSLGSHVFISEEFGTPGVRTQIRDYVYEGCLQLSFSPSPPN